MVTDLYFKTKSAEPLSKLFLRLRRYLKNTIYSIDSSFSVQGSYVLFLLDFCKTRSPLKFEWPLLHESVALVTRQKYRTTCHTTLLQQLDYAELRLELVFQIFQRHANEVGSLDQTSLS